MCGRLSLHLNCPFLLHHTDQTCVVRCKSYGKKRQSVSNRAKWFLLPVNPWLLGTISLWPAVSLPLTLSYWQWVLSPKSQVCALTLMIQSQKAETKRLTAQLGSALSGGEWLTSAACCRFSGRWDESWTFSMFNRKERKLLKNPKPKVSQEVNSIQESVL